MLHGFVEKTFVGLNRDQVFVLLGIVGVLLEKIAPHLDGFVATADAGEQAAAQLGDVGGERVVGLGPGGGFEVDQGGVEVQRGGFGLCLEVVRGGRAGVVLQGVAKDPQRVGVAALTGQVEAVDQGVGRVVARGPVGQEGFEGFSGGLGEPGVAETLEHQPGFGRAAQRGVVAGGFGRDRFGAGLGGRLRDGRLGVGGRRGEGGQQEAGAEGGPDPAAAVGLVLRHACGTT